MCQALCGNWKYRGERNGLAIKVSGLLGAQRSKETVACWCPCCSQERQVRGPRQPGGQRMCKRLDVILSGQGSLGAGRGLSRSGFIKHTPCHKHHGSAGNTAGNKTFDSTSALPRPPGKRRAYELALGSASPDRPE